MADDEDPESAAGYTRTDPPRTIRVEEDVHTLYEELQSDSESPFEGARYLDIFLAAAALGSYEGLRQPVEGDTNDLFNLTSLSREHKTIIRSLAWKETHNEEIYYDQQQAYKISMEFANGGIHRLHSQGIGMGDTVSKAVTDYVSRWQSIEDELNDSSLLER
jgi:hypothetical protein